MAASTVKSCGTDWGVYTKSAGGRRETWRRRGGFALSRLGRGKHSRSRAFRIDSGGILVVRSVFKRGVPMKRHSSAVLIAIVAFALSALAQAPSQLFGTWKLDV